MTAIARITTLLALTVLLGACASKPATPEYMSAQVTELEAQLALRKSLISEWNSGQRLLRSGERKLRQGEEQIRKAEILMQRGQGTVNAANLEISQGTQLMEVAEARLREAFPDADPLR